MLKARSRTSWISLKMPFLAKALIQIQYNLLWSCFAALIQIPTTWLVTSGYVPLVQEN